MIKPEAERNAAAPRNQAGAATMRTAGKGGAIAISGQGIKLFLQLVSTAVLARLLTPQDFGVMSLAMPLIAFLTVFRDFGLTSATIYSEDITAREVSSLFYINVTVGVVLAIALLCLAPLAATVFNDPRLAPVLTALALVFVLNGIGAQYQALFQRGFRFGTLTAIDVTSTVAGISLGLGAAWMGFGYWSLAVIPIATQISNLVATIACSDWHPLAPRWEKRTGSMAKFGSDIAGFNLLNYFARNLDNLLIGKFWGLESLGFYGRAYSLMMAPLTQIIYPLSQVVVPILTRVTNDENEYRRIFMTILRVAMLVCVPLVTWLLVGRGWIIDLMLGPQWVQAVPMFLALGFSALVQPVNNSAGWLMMSQGRSRDVLKWGAIGCVLTVASILAGLPWGALGVAMSYSLFQVAIITPLLWWFCCRRGPVRMRDLGLASFPPWGAALVAGGSAEWARQAIVHAHGEIAPLPGLAGSFVFVFGIYTALVSLDRNSRRTVQKYSARFVMRRS